MIPEGGFTEEDNKRKVGQFVSMKTMDLKKGRKE